MTKKPLTPTYAKLIQTLKKQLQDGLIKMEQLVQYQRVVTYWQMGRSLDLFLEAQAGPQKPHLNKIGKQMDFSYDLLSKMVKFYRCYPKLNPNLKLSWAQYKAMLTASAEERPRLEKMVVKTNMGSDSIYAYISEQRQRLKSENGDAKKLPSKRNQLKTTRGRLYHYKTLQSKHLGLTAGEMMVDIGFKSCTKVDIPKKSSLSGGHIITSVKNEKGYQLKYTNAKESCLYTYTAKVRRVIDADTLAVTVDCGFNIWMDLTARLCGIDAPEKSTAKGLSAHQYVKDRLKPGNDIVIKTYKAEKYGRYLADVYYLAKEKDPLKIAAEGVYLNQELLDEGMAVVYDGGKKNLF